MKSKLINKSKNNTLIADKLTTAISFWARLKGLLGTESLTQGEGLWIHHCNSIHMFFMRFAIDAVFVDPNLKVLATYKNLRPWRMTGIVWRASSVFELPAGTSDLQKIDVGDELYVGD